MVMINGLTGLPNVGFSGTCLLHAYPFKLTGVYMNNIKQRLAKANGMNSLLCFRAKDHIDYLEKIIRVCHAAALPDPQDERPLDTAALKLTILTETSKVVKERWNYENSKL
jgi:hypothetical protein